MHRITPLQESIFTLNYIHNKLLYYHEQGTNLPIPADPKEHERMAIFILDITIAYGIVLVQSFVDECDTHFFLSIYEPLKKKFIKDRCKPALKEIRKYADLRKYRNYLAHGREGNSLQSSNIIITADHYDYDIPQNFVEYCFILNCIEVIIKIINHVYPDAFDYVNRIKKEYSSNKPVKPANISEDSVYKAKLQALKDEINAMPE